MPETLALTADLGDTFGFIMLMVLLVSFVFSCAQLGASTPDEPAPAPTPDDDEPSDG